MTTMIFKEPQKKSSIGINSHLKEEKEQLSVMKRELFNMQLTQNILGSYGGDRNTSFDAKIEELRKEIELLEREMSS
jgi:hypothetical protein